MLQQPFQQNIPERASQDAAQHLQQMKHAFQFPQYAPQMGQLSPQMGQLTPGIQQEPPWVNKIISSFDSKFSKLEAHVKTKLSDIEESVEFMSDSFDDW